ncbi:MAG: sigma 54-interacting transcriptional regulator [Pyrinomonadaceae bacterium]
MNQHASLLRQLNDPTLSPNEQAEVRCRLVRELAEVGDYEAARSAMGELWQRIGERPRINGLDQHIAAEILLCSGLLTGWLGSAHQVAGAQEIAKDIINEGFRIFESLGLTAKAAEAQIEIALCYWRESAYDESRIRLRDAISRLNNEDIGLRALALLRSAIVEKSEKRFNDAISILNEAAPLIKKCGSHTLEGTFHNTLAIALEVLGVAEHREDYTDRALIEYEAASFNFEQAGHTRYRARVENNLGFLLFTASRFTEAHEHLDRARRLFTSLKDKGSIAQVDDTRARAFLAQDNNVEAEKIARSAVRALQRGGEQGLLSGALTTYGTALARLGRDSHARFALQRATEVAHTAGNNEKAGLAALTIIEELGERLELDEMRGVYEVADELLAISEYPQTIARLRLAARRVLAAGRERQRGGEKDARIERANPSNPSKFVYRSKVTAEIVRDAKRIAAAAGSVLITGEEGTGKRLLASLMHEWSGRKGQFVAVNCEALTETLIESELFGNRKDEDDEEVEERVGAVRQAAGGTLYLDEITELSNSNQARLLRLIERGEMQSIGALELERLDVRIIVGSNGSLGEEVAQELFREDLFYRLRTFQLEIPPLKERPEDIPALAEHFIREALGRYGQRVIFTPEAIEAMQKFPLEEGNARELKLLIERTVMTAPWGTTITRSEVETLVLRQTKTANLADVWAGCSLSEEVRRYEGSLIKMALDATDGHITHAARLLGTTHQGLAYILQGRHKDLLTSRKPVRKRRRSIIKKKSN